MCCLLFVILELSGFFVFSSCVLDSDCAVTMQEAERDSPKKWTPVVEIQYRGGIYRGRCQGGLPEGKVFELLF